MRQRHALIEITAQRGARNVRVFGSVARGEDTEASDIGLLVDLDEGVSLVTLSGLRRQLTELLGAEVDVVPSANLKPGVRDICPCRVDRIVSHHDDQRLADILAAARPIASHTGRGGLDDGLVFDAVRVRLIEIGEAVKAIDPVVLATEPEIPWRDIAGIRDHLAHRYLTPHHSIVAATIANDLPPVVAAGRRLIGCIEAEPGR